MLTEYDTLQLTRDPATKQVHFLIDDGSDLGVSLCGDGHAGDYPPAPCGPTAPPLTLGDLCRECCRQLGWVAVEQWPYLLTHPR